MAAPEPPVSKIEFNNIARYVGVQHGEDWHEWAVYVDEPENVLDQIEAVEYLLHRTFPNPLRRTTNSKDNFLCQSSGWGGFNIQITVFFKNGARLHTTHLLDLSKAWSAHLLVGGKVSDA